MSHATTPPVHDRMFHGDDRTKGRKSVVLVADDGTRHDVPGWIFQSRPIGDRVSLNINGKRVSGVLRER